MNRVPLGVFIIEDDSNYDINTGTAEKLRQNLININNIIISFMISAIKGTVP